MVRSKQWSTPFNRLMNSLARNPMYYDGLCPFGELLGLTSDYSWDQAVHDYPGYLSAVRQWCWDSFCASWVVVSHAAIIGRE